MAKFIGETSQRPNTELKVASCDAMNLLSP